MSDVNQGGGGYYNPFSPPTPEEYKRQWQQAYENRPIEYERKADKNRKQAIKEILQDQVRNAVKPVDSLNEVFRKEIGK